MPVLIEGVGNFLEIIGRGGELRIFDEALNLNLRLINPNQLYRSALVNHAGCGRTRGRIRMALYVMHRRSYCRLSR
jgi:hypothetical protein